MFTIERTEVHYKSLFGDNYFIIAVIIKDVYPGVGFFAGIQAFSMKLFLKLNS